MKDVKTSFITKEKIPLVIQPKTKQWTVEQTYDWIGEHREEIAQKVLDHGGVLFRGFPIEGPEGFARAIETLDYGKPLNYIGGDSPRDKVKGQVYTSTEAPRKMTLPLHNEMSFIRDYPKHIYFYCQIPAQVGGATILGDARAILKEVDPDVLARFQENGLRYVSNYYARSMIHELINKIQRGHKSWHQVFETSSKQEVEQLCNASGFEYTWNSGDWLQIAQHAPATMTHPTTGEDVWFNQAHLYQFNPRLIGFWNWIGTKCVYVKKDTLMHEIYYGNKKPIPKKDLYHVMDVLDKKTISYPWQKRDFIVLDNVLTMHGRAPFEGPRRILTALTR